ncbi:MAG TPA: GyrI-like domain-containing protein [Nocardioidaceae bacterium]|nr:GyrI-like domain-containing protein [Nocardioidaceae bacterium]
MTYTVQLVDLQEQPAAVVRGHVTHEGIADFLGPAFGEVIGAVEREGGHPVGAPFGRYRPTDDGGWDLTAGFPVSRPVTPAGRVEPETLPGGRAARTLHVGDYAGLAAAYEAAMAWLTDNGYVVTGEPWECYLDGPEVPEPRTEVFIPCTEARPHHA